MPTLVLREADLFDVDPRNKALAPTKLEPRSSMENTTGNLIALQMLATHPAAANTPSVMDVPPASCSGLSAMKIHAMSAHPRAAPTQNLRLARTTVVKPATSDRSPNTSTVMSAPGQTH